MSQLQRTVHGGDHDQDARKADTSDLSSAAARARAALDQSDAALAAQVAELRNAIKGNQRQERNFERKAWDMCSC